MKERSEEGEMTGAGMEGEEVTPTPTLVSRRTPTPTPVPPTPTRTPRATPTPPDKTKAEATTPKTGLGEVLLVLLAGLLLGVLFISRRLRKA